MKKIWTKDEIKNLLDVNDVAVIRGMLRIYQLQTFDEQASEDAKYRNNVGFSGCDAFIMSKFAAFFMERGYLTQKQFNLAKKRIMKYVGQLTKIANGEIL